MTELCRRGLLAGAGLLAVAGGASAASLPPDARLVAICDTYVRADERHSELCKRQMALGDARLTADGAAEWSRLDNLVDEQAAIMDSVEDEIATLPATTPAGLRAKAGVVSCVGHCIRKESGGDLVRSLLADLLPAGVI